MNTETQMQDGGAVASKDGLGVNRVGTKILGLAWGEQDRPDAALLASVAEVRDFIIHEWLGDGDSAILDEVMRELAAHDWEESREKEWAFEVGGLSLRDVFDMTPNAELSDRRPKTHEHT